MTTDLFVDWPYAEDGVERDDLAESLRIPIVNTLSPRWRYITAVYVSPSPWRRGIQPAQYELRIIASFHEEYLAYWYNQSYLNKLAERPFDVDGAANGRLLAKHGHGGWGYRLASWTRGPAFVPEPQAPPSTLIQVMDRIHTIGDTPFEHWVQWKATHPDVFGGAR